MLKGRQQLLAAALLSTTLPTFAACDYGQRGELHPYGLIGKAWESMGGETSPLGCPIGPEANTPASRGRYQTFQFGEISWSPDRGNHSLLIGYQAGNNAIELVWAGVEPFNYDFWIVRTDVVPGGNIVQKDLSVERTKGFYVFRGATVGQKYLLYIEGCDEGTFVPGQVAKCRQGWLNGVTVVMKPNPIKKNATMPDPPDRTVSCALKPKCIADVAQDVATYVGPVLRAFGM